MKKLKFWNDSANYAVRYFSDSCLSISLTNESHLKDNARYCLIRLVLRKVNQWLPLSSLEKYTKEVGEKGLEAAVYDLCLPFGDLYEQQPVVKMEPTVAVSEPGISIRNEDSAGNVNLFKDLDVDDVDDMNPNISDSSIMTTPLRKEVFDGVWPQRAGPSQLPQPEDPIKAVLHSDRSNIQIDFFCENEIAMTTQEILGRLSKELLVGLAKEMKCKVRPNSKARLTSPCFLFIGLITLAERRHYIFASTAGCKSANPQFWYSNNKKGEGKISGSLSTNSTLAHFHQGTQTENKSRTTTSRIGYKTFG
jgi:hypothetical protein